MGNSETYQAIIEINSKQAQNNIEELRQQQKAASEELIRLKDKDSKATKQQISLAEKHLKTVTKQLQEEIRHAKGLDTAMQQLSTKTYKELGAEVRALNKMMRDGSVEKNSAEWKALAERIKAAKREMKEYEDATKEVLKKEPLWKRFIVGLNTHWGAITQIIGAVTGLTVAVRSSVKAYASMEEAMADTRKYTGLSDAAIRELNEDLKKIDTRTSREELNELAGAAGRLGKTSRQDILDFVDAGNQIKVALGDDLGEGAIDKVGKLAMAFGEDEKMGLRGAMLATGSAVNELAQNSSAQAGYLVDFTARVAGFGKQLGLTQAQIMGFGAVMDENLLRDEMAATAFGNMLTKMQTDTAKFARIAGMDMKKFSELLKTDANAAILALADSLKKADPQTMMKMLDDMGLDGSRAVGVLSTLADKIDDVRARQELATKAYKEGTSVSKEYATMNNTVEAGIEKAKKKFIEMAVELGERLMPVVKYTISGTAEVIKILNILTGFVAKHITAVTSLVITLGLLTAAWNAHTVSVKISNAADTVKITLTKALAVVMGTLKQALMAARIAVAALSGNYVKLNWLMTESNRLGMTNPWAALATVMVTVGIAVWGAVEAWKAHREEIENNLLEMKKLQAQQKVEREINKQVADSTAERRTRVEQLTKVIHSNVYSVDERRKAIKALQAIIPQYHASISSEGKLYKENSNAIKDYIQNLNDAALAEAIYTKKVEINGKKLDLQRKQQRIEGSLKAVQAERDAHPERYKTVTRWVGDGHGGVYSYEEENANLKESNRQKARHEQRLKDNKQEQEEVKAEEQYLDRVLQKNTKVQQLYNNNLRNKSGNGSGGSGGGSVDYTPEDKKKKGNKTDQEKKERQEHLRQLREESMEEKALMDSRLADNMLAYSAGKKNYRQFVADQQRIREEGLLAQMKVWEGEAAEYEKYRLQLVALQTNGDQELTRLRLDDMEREHQMVVMKLRASFADENSEYYQNEDALNEALFQADMIFLEEKKNLYREGSLERMQIEEEIDIQEKEHQLEREQEFQERLRDIKVRYLQQSDTEREQMELNALEQRYQGGLVKEEEYQRARMAIKAQYANGTTEGEKTAQAGANAAKVAQNEVREGAGAVADIPIVGTVAVYAATMARLKQMREDDEISHRDYLAAKMEATKEFCKKVASEIQAAYESINQVMSAASQLYSAQADLETAEVKKKYEQQIAAAGNNQKRVKMLQEKQAKEEAAIKTKYNRKQVKIQIAQALAQTATNALNAYGSAAAIPTVGYIIAPIAAAMAAAAGMIQVAAIKKQAAAQEAGYYEGGFTKGNHYRKEAGVVHEGEFVANHQAVNNPNVLPLLEFIDRAQRNNTVGSLTREDINRHLGTGSSVVAPVVNVSTDNTDMKESADILSEAAADLKEQLANPIPCYVVLDGPDGLVNKLKHLENLKNP